MCASTYIQVWEITFENKCWENLILFLKCFEWQYSKIPQDGDITP